MLQNVLIYLYSDMLRGGINRYRRSLILILVSVVIIYISLSKISWTPPTPHEERLRKTEMEMEHRGNNLAQDDPFLLEIIREKFLIPPPPKSSKGYSKEFLEKLKDPKTKYG